MEYATRDQAQHAVNSLSNQNLMGRLVYVREVRIDTSYTRVLLVQKLTIRRTAKQNLVSTLNSNQDHHTEDPVQDLVQVIKEDLEAVWAGAGAGVLVLDLAVKSMYPTSVYFRIMILLIPFADRHIKLPYTVGWQDLKDLFRQAGIFPPTPSFPVAFALSFFPYSPTMCYAKRLFKALLYEPMCTSVPMVVQRVVVL